MKRSTCVYCMSLWMSSCSCAFSERYVVIEFVLVWFRLLVCVCVWWCAWMSSCFHYSWHINFLKSRILWVCLGVWVFKWVYAHAHMCVCACVYSALALHYKRTKQQRSLDLQDRRLQKRSLQLSKELISVSALYILMVYIIFFWSFVLFFHQLSFIIFLSTQEIQYRWTILVQA